MIKYTDFMKKLQEEAPANSVGPGGISPPAAPNPTSTNIPIGKPKLVKRKLK